MTQYLAILSTLATLLVVRNAPLCAQSVATSAAAAVDAVAPLPVDASPDLAAIWNDPTFQRQFVGAYGVNAEIEPRVTKEDVILLEKVRPFMADDLPKAEAMLRKGMKPDCSAIFDFTLGGVLFQQDKLIDALACFREAVRKFPSFRRAYRNIGLISARSSDFPSAIAAFNRVIELGGADPYMYGLLGFAHGARQDFQPAEAAYGNALLLQPTNLEWRLGLTRCVFKQGKFEDAVALLDVLITDFPDKADFWMLQAQAFLGLKQPLKAAMNLEAMDVLGKSTLDSLQTLGDVYLSESLPDLAIDAYKRALVLDPAQPMARSVRSAELLASRGFRAQAQGLIAAIKGSRVGEMEDAEKGKLLKLEARLAMADGGGSEATAAVLEEIVRIDPLDGEALMLLGQHHTRKGETDRAMLAYERAAGIEACAANAKVRQAQIMVSQSRFADALALLRAAQELKPREDVARYLEQVERISKSKR